MTKRYKKEKDLEFDGEENKAKKYINQNKETEQNKYKSNENDDEEKENYEIDDEEESSENHDKEEEENEIKSDNKNEENEKIKYKIENILSAKENNSLDIKKQIKENEKMIKLKKLMFTRQKYMRSQFSKYSEGKTKNDMINEFLEDMCIYSNIIKKEIEENQDKYIKIEDALKMEDKDEGLFCLGIS